MLPEFERYRWDQRVDGNRLQGWFLDKGARQTVIYYGGNAEDLRIMDTYMAGLVRWINQVGISTTCSCDGRDGRRNHSPSIETKDIAGLDEPVAQLNDIIYYLES